MNSVLSDLGSWFWRLVPANPILVRVVLAGGRRVSHLYIRMAYLAVLIAFMGGAALTFQSGTGSSLADMAKSATQVFKVVSFAQLAMVCVLAPIFAASAITQEKNSQTFNILLSTPLTNGQIVLGSLLSRLYFVFVLLLAGVPLFCILMVYGGVTSDKIALAFALSACTAAFTGSLAIAISVIKIGTGRTIFSFYLCIAAYLIAVYMLAQTPMTIPAEAVPAPGGTDRMSWLAAFHPFLAMNVSEGTTPAPPLGAVQHYGFPFKYWAAYPHYSFIAMTLLSSAVMIVSCLFFVRRGMKEGEPTLLNRLFKGVDAAAEAQERTRKPRHVGHNPVAWRESNTRVSAGGGSLVRYSLLGLGFILGIVILILYRTGGATPATARLWVFGMVEVELLIALFIGTTTAATSMTREKESNTLSLLLCTPITSGQIIFGKVKGLIILGLPMLIPPYATVVMFCLFDAMWGRYGANAPAEAVVGLEALLTLPILFVAFMAATCAWGLACSIKQTKTILSVMWSILATGGVGALASACAIGSVSSGAPTFAAVVMPFAPFHAVFVAVDPALALKDTMTSVTTSTDMALCRTVAAVASLAAAALWCFVAWGLHKSSVRNFDMTIRKQMA